MSQRWIPTPLAPGAHAARVPIRMREPDGRARGGRPDQTATALAHALAFAGAAGLILAYALRGGSYDIVVFEEYGFVIWAVLAIGIALRLLPRAKPSRAALVLMGAMLAYAGWTALSLTWTQSGELSFEETARSLGYLGLIALVICSLDGQTWRSAAAGLGLAALAVCVLSDASRLAPGSFPPNVVGSIFGVRRLSYPFGYWNAVGAWGAISATIGVAWSAHERARLSRAVALALVPAAGLAVYLSYSRAGVAGTALGAILVVLLSRNRFTALIHVLVAAAGAGVLIVIVRQTPAIANGTGTAGAGKVAGVLAFSALFCGAFALVTTAVGSDRWAFPQRWVRPLAIAGAIVVLVPCVALGPHLVSRAWHSFTKNTTVQSSDPAARLTSLSGSRYGIWKVAMKAFDRDPLTGTGAGTFEFWWNQHGTDVEFLRDTHSIWVENLAELGLPGLLLIVAVSVSAIVAAGMSRRKARRRVTAGAGAAFLAGFIVYLLTATFDWMWEIPAVTALALAGVAAVSLRLSEPLGGLRWPVRAALVALATVGALVQVPGLMSTIEIRDSQAAERAGHGAQALAWANDAVAAEPWAASPYEQRGLVLEAGGRLAAAARSLRRAVDNERTNYAHWLVLARIEAERGLIGPAVHDYDRARQLRPKAGVFLLAEFFRAPG